MNSLIVYICMNVNAFVLYGRLPKLEEWCAVPNLKFLIFMQEEGGSVLMDAYEYITRLQKSVDDLNTELVPLCIPANLSAAFLDEESLDVASAAQSTNAGSICVLYQHPMVCLHLQFLADIASVRLSMLWPIRLICFARSDFRDSSWTNSINSKLACSFEFNNPAHLDSNYIEWLWWYQDTSHGLVFIEEIDMISVAGV